MIKYRDPVTGQWEKLPYIPGNSGLPAVTPEMYGAKGDGKTDDTEAIQKAVDACGTKELPGTLYFSNRAYRITAPIVAQRKLNIEGRLCVIQVDSQEVLDAAFALQKQTDARPTVIRDVTVQCRGKAKNGFRIGSGDRDDTAANQITVDNCYVSDATEDGFKLVPMAYCVRFLHCCAIGNGGSGISVVGTDSHHQVNAVTVDGCSLLMNRKHGVHVSGVHIVVENCIIELNGIRAENGSYSYVETTRVYDQDLKQEVTAAVGSGVYVGVKGYPSRSIVIQNNYFEPSADAQITVSTTYASVRVQNNYFLCATGKVPAGHWITNVRCVHSGDMSSAVELVYRNNTAADGARTAEGDMTSGRMDVDGGKILDYFSRVDAQYVRNTQLTRLTYPPQGGTRYFIPLSLSTGAPHEKGTDNKSVNLVADEVQKIAIVLPFAMYNSVFRLIGFNAITDGTSVTIRNRIHVKDANGTQLKGTYFDYTMTSGTVEGRDSITGNMVDNLWHYSCWDNVINNFGYYNIPNNSFVEVTFELVSVDDTTSVVVISNPFIDIYNP